MSYFPEVKAKIVRSVQEKKQGARSQAKAVLCSSLNRYSQFDKERPLGFSYCSPEKSEVMILNNIRAFKKRK